MTDKEKLDRVKHALATLRSLSYGCTGGRAEGQDPKLVGAWHEAYETAIALLTAALYP